MTAFDIILLIIFVAATFTGWRKGLMRQIGIIAAVIAGILLCRSCGDEFARYLQACGLFDSEANDEGYLSSDYLIGVLARVLLFVGGFVVVKALASMLRSATRGVGLGLLDHIGGAAVRLLVWLTVISVALNLWIAIKPQTNLHSMSRMFNGHAIEAIVKIAPAALGFATETAIFCVESDNKHKQKQP